MHTRHTVATLLILGGCATAPAAMNRALAVSGVASSLPDSAAPSHGVEAVVVVRVVNQTGHPYRMQLSYGGVVHTLGSVTALETRQFQIARYTIVGYEQFHLLAAVRDNGTDQRESEEFSFNGASVVEWSLDAMRTRSVTLR